MQRQRRLGDRDQAEGRTEEAERQNKKICQLLHFITRVFSINLPIYPWYHYFTFINKGFLHNLTLYVGMGMGIFIQQGTGTRIGDGDTSPSKEEGTGTRKHPHPRSRNELDPRPRPPPRWRWRFFPIVGRGPHPTAIPRWHNHAG